MKRSILLVLFSWILTLHSPCQEITKDILIQKLKLSEQYVERLSYEYSYQTEVLNGFQAYNDAVIKIVRRANPSNTLLSALTKDQVEGIQDVVQQSYNGITKRIIKDNREISPGDYDFITDGQQYVYYDPHLKRATIDTKDLYPNFLPIDVALTHVMASHFILRKGDYAVSDFIRLGSQYDITQQAGKVKCEIRILDPNGKVQYHGLRLILDPKSDFRIDEYEQFVGSMINGAPRDETPDVICNLSQYEEIAPGVSIPFVATWSEIYSKDDDNHNIVRYPYLKHTIVLKKVYDYAPDTMGPIKLALPLGAFISDSISGTTYKLGPQKPNSIMQTQDKK